MRSSTSNSRHAFTLVELLVVITIIGILVGLLLPAVQSARESGRKAQCSNNFHQIGLAMKHHETDHGNFPAGGWGWGWVGDADRGYGWGQPGGWIYNTLPYMELGNLHDLGIGTDPTLTNPTNATKMAANSQRVATPVGGFICPSRRAVAAYLYGQPFSYHPPANYNQTLMVAKTDYAANGGDKYCSPDALGLWPSNCGNSACGPAVSAIPSTPAALTALNSQVMQFSPTTMPSGSGSQYGPTGIVCAVNMTTASEISDGLANTYLVAEKYLDPDEYTDGADEGDNETMYIGDNEDISRYTYEAPMQDRRGMINYITFGSPHVNGFNACMCDGSVRAISYGINAQVHQYLGNRADGVAVITVGSTQVPVEPPPP